MIDIRKLKELVRLMKENDLSELDLRDNDETVTLKRGVNQQAVPGPPVPAPAPEAPPPEPKPKEATTSSEDGFVAIESPMVGTFYAAPNPDAEPFVGSGSNVAPDTVICLIEAMKVFNEIKAETTGLIEKILVNNGETVEFGQKLFLIKPS